MTLQYVEFKGEKIPVYKLIKIHISQHKCGGCAKLKKDRRLKNAYQCTRKVFPSKIPAWVSPVFAKDCKQYEPEDIHK